MNELIVDVKPKRVRKTKKAIQEEKDNLENNIQNKVEMESIHQKSPDVIELIISEEKGIMSTEMVEDILSINIIDDDECEDDEPRKKRGRKPKGGKIIQHFLPINCKKEDKPNIIMHLKCSLKDLDDIGVHNSNFTTTTVDPFNFESELTFGMLESNTKIKNYIGPSQLYEKQDNSNSNSNSDNENLLSTKEEYKLLNEIDNKEIWKKLKTLEQNLQMNNISDKKSACFWCTYDFDNPSIYIPKYFINNSYQVYGCFCTPECAVAHLMSENIDSTTKFERYHLINYIYSKIYEYKIRIKPAPNPYYMLDKYYGNLNIQEYRSLLKSDRLFLIVDKPLTRIMPEIHEDSNDFIINNKIIPCNSYQVKKKIQKKQPQNKNTIVSEKFGLGN
jgi:hypothetical protein